MMAVEFVDVAGRHGHCALSGAQAISSRIELLDVIFWLVNTQMLPAMFSAVSAFLGRHGLEQQRWPQPGRLRRLNP